MERKRKCTLFAKMVLTFVVVMLMLIGCGSEGTDPKQATPSAVAALAEATANPRQAQKAEDGKGKEESKAGFDPMEVAKGDLETNFEEVLKHVTICGKKVSFPLTLKQLEKKGFTFKKTEYQSEKETFLMGDLYLGKKPIAFVWVENGQVSKHMKKEVTSLIQFKTRDFSPENGVSICGIGFDSSEDLIREVFGEPTDEDAVGLTYRKNGKSKRRISFNFFSKGVPTQIDVAYYL